MNTYVDKKQESKNQSISSANSKMQSSGESTFQCVDNRPEAIAQRKFQETINNSPQMKQATQLQAKTENHAYKPGTGILLHVQKRESDKELRNDHIGVTQRVEMTLKQEQPNYVELTATAPAKEYQKRGSGPSNVGWIGVEKFKAMYRTHGDHNSNGKITLINRFIEPQRGHILAQRNSGNGKDPNNMFAQEGGTNNGSFKSFEGKMANSIEDCNPDDNVFFRVTLYGDNIYKGEIPEQTISGIDDDSYSEGEDNWLEPQGVITENQALKNSLGLGHLSNADAANEIYAVVQGWIVQYFPSSQYFFEFQEGESFVNWMGRQGLDRDTLVSYYNQAMESDSSSSSYEMIVDLN